MAASRAASTVIDAANAIEVSRLVFHFCWFYLRKIDFLVNATADTCGLVLGTLVVPMMIQ